MSQVTRRTGSESQRRERSGRRPLTAPTNQTPRFVVPAGKPDMYRRADKGYSCPYTTTCENGFDRFEQIEEGCLVFRNGGHLFMVNG